MKKKLVIVSGASRGLGLALTRRLLDEGYRVAGIARSFPQSLTLNDRIAAGDFIPVPFDLINTTDIHALVLKIVREHGPVYGLINNAAVGSDGVLATMHERDIADSLQVNLVAPILLAKYCLRSMMLYKSGRIINIGSIVSTTGFSGLSLYAAAKSGLVGFTKSLAREAGKLGITVNCVLPGYMETEMTKSLQGEKLESIKRRSSLGRLATVQDAAAMVLFLLSDNASGITGAQFTVDAGSTA